MKLLFSLFLLVAVIACSSAPPAPIWNADRVQRAVAVLGAGAVEAAATLAAQKNAPMLLAALDTSKDGILQVSELLLADFTDAQVLAVALAAAMELRR